VNSLISTVWTDPILKDFETKNKALHVTELRQATNALEGKAHDIFKRIGFGTIGDLVVNSVSAEPFKLIVEPFKAYFPDGVVFSFPAITVVFDSPSVVSHTNEVYTSTGGYIDINNVPMVDSTGLITNAIVVKKLSDGSSISVLAVDPITGVVQLDLVEDIDVYATYKSGKKRYDVLYVTSDGNHGVVEGSPTYGLPVKPVMPDGAVELLTVLIRPKETAVGIAESDIMLVRYGTSGGGISNVIVDDAEPIAKSVGLLWLDSTIQVLKYWDGATWIPINSDNTIISEYGNSVLENVTNTVPIPIPNINGNLTPLFVFQNSVFLSRNVDYSVSIDGKSIVKTMGTWDIGTELDFINLLTVSNNPNTLTIACLESHFIAAVDNTTYIPVNNQQYNTVSDVLQVFYNNMLLYKGDDYTLNDDGISIKLVTGINTGDKIKFFIWKKVRTVVGEVDGSTLMDGSVTRSKLAPPVINELEEVTVVDSITTAKYKLKMEGGEVFLDSVVT